MVLSPMISPILLFFFKIALAALVPLSFHINFIIILYISIKSLGDFEYLCINYRRIDIFTMLILLIYELGMFIHLFRSTSKRSFICFAKNLHLCISLSDCKQHRIFISASFIYRKQNSQ